MRSLPAFSVASASVLPVLGFQGSSRSAEFDYDVESFDGRVGAVARLVVEGETIPIREKGAICFDLLYNQRSACEGCPLVSMTRSPQSNVLVRARVEETACGPQTLFETTTVEPLDARHVRLRVRNISEDILRQLRAAKVQGIFEEAGLTPREQVVLRQLIEGGSIAYIAAALKIAPRTVKHHQANILHKLKVDSRYDLVRLAL